MRITYLFAATLALAVMAAPMSAQSRHERKMAQIEESAKPKNVPGGIKFQVSKSYQDTYESALNWIKKADYTIELADKETGQIATAMTITGGYRQTGTRLILTLIKESDSVTTVKVAVTQQKRSKLLQAEPWGDPKVNDDESQKIVDQLKAVI